MSNNILTWHAALQQGLEPWLYSYNEGDIPGIPFTARLDFKIWAKKLMAINGYFTVDGTWEKLQLTVYCHFETGRYTIAPALDFVTCPTGRLYQVQAMAGQKKKSTISAAILIS